MANAKQCDRCGKFYSSKVELLGPSECEKCKKETLCSGECLKKYVNVNSFYTFSDYGIKRVIFHDPATIVFWTDGTKIDICQECMDSLKKWWDMKQKED